MPRSLKFDALSAIGAIAGGAAGYFLFHFIYKYGFWGPFIPAGMLGAGCAALSADRSKLRGVLCGVAGLVLGLYTDWMHFRWPNDDSLVYYVTHLHNLGLFKWSLLLLGALLASWLGRDSFGVVQPK